MSSDIYNVSSHKLHGYILVHSCILGPQGLLGDSRQWSDADDDADVES